MTNSIVLNAKFVELTGEETMQVEGGLFPIVLVAFGVSITITKGAAIAAGIFTAGAVIGGIVAYNS